MKLINKNLTKTLKNIGIKSERITLENKLALLLHLLPAVIKDGHMISIGAPGVGKTTAIEKSSQKVSNIKTISLASFFGNQQKQEKGIISDENDIVYFEQASGIDNIGKELIGNIFTHCTGGVADRIKSEIPSNRTSIVALGNPEEEYYFTDYKEKYDFPKKIDKDYFQCLPSEFAKRQGLERFIVLPTFVMEKIEKKVQEDESYKTLNFNRVDTVKWNIKSEEFDARQYMEACKIITFLNYILNDNSPELEKNEVLFNGFLEIAKSIINLKNGKYRPFYRNSLGRALALLLLESDELKIEDIEEAHFLKNRVLIRKKNENILFKIALNPFGKIDNYREFLYYQENKLEEIAEIISLSKDGIELKQRYYPLCGDYYKVDFSKINGETTDPILLKIQKLEEENNKKSEEIESLKKAYNILVQNMYSIKMQKDILYNTPPTLILASKEDQNFTNFQKTLEIKGFRFKHKISKSNIGENKGKLLLINFSDYLK